MIQVREFSTSHQCTSFSLQSCHADKILGLGAPVNSSNVQFPSFGGLLSAGGTEDEDPFKASCKVEF